MALNGLFSPPGSSEQTLLPRRQRCTLLLLQLWVTFVLIRMLNAASNPKFSIKGKDLSQVMNIRRVLLFKGGEKLILLEIKARWF